MNHRSQATPDPGSHLRRESVRKPPRGRSPARYGPGRPLSLFGPCPKSCRRADGSRCHDADGCLPCPGHAGRLL